MENRARRTRGTALSKLAAISAVSAAGNTAHSDLERLYRPYSERRSRGSKNETFQQDQPLEAAHIPMEFKELEILLALCKAGPMILDLGSARDLLRQLAPYLLEVHEQIFAQSPYLRAIEPSPWEALSFNLSSAILSIGSNHAPLRSAALDAIQAFLEQLCKAAEIVSTRVQEEDGDSGDEEETVSTNVESAIQIAMITVSVLGSLGACAKYAGVWDTAGMLKMVTLLQHILSEKFLISVETAFSTLRNAHSADHRLKEWKRHMRHYAATGQPLGAMLLQWKLIQLAVSRTACLLNHANYRSEEDLLGQTLIGNDDLDAISPDDTADDQELVQTLADMAARQMDLLEDGADFLQLGSAWQQRLAFGVKASTVVTSVLCLLVERDTMDAEVLLSWLDDIISDPVQMSDQGLACVTLRSIALLAKMNPTDAPLLSRSLLRFVVRGPSQGRVVDVAANCLSVVLRLLSQDAIITTLYTLGNTLSVANDEQVVAAGSTPNGSIRANLRVSHFGQQGKGSAISLALGAEEDMNLTYGNVIHTIVCIASGCHDGKITALAQNMLVQKIGKINPTVDARIIAEVATLALVGETNELRSLLRLYSKICHDGLVQENTLMLDAVAKAHDFLALNIPIASPLHDLYLVHLLETVVSKGDVQMTKSARRADYELAAEEIAQFLSPLSLLVSRSNLRQEGLWGDEVLSLARDAWFNIVVHGFTTASEPRTRNTNHLRLLAAHSCLLIPRPDTETLEGDIELNTVLRRGMALHHDGDIKKALIALLPGWESQIRALSYPKLNFVRAVYLMETVRAEMGDCSTILSYFTDPALATGTMGECLQAIADAITGMYIQRCLQNDDPQFSASNMAKQLAALFKSCCHRVEMVRRVAYDSVDRIIRAAPSALCQRESLFALLELLTLMWKSCLEEETDEFQWSSSFTSPRGGVSIELSDDYRVRRGTLDALHTNARSWVTRVINIAPLNVKGLLQTYLAEFTDDGALGQVCLGRSFALEMGFGVPETDQTLGALERQSGVEINTASDFVAQYTIRQAYKLSGNLAGDDKPELASVPLTRQESLEVALSRLEDKISHHTHVSDNELRDILHRAAVVSCSAGEGSCAMVHRLVAIPFAIFTKQAISLGISLWLSVINDHPTLEARLLVDIAVHWQDTVQKRLGMFDSRLNHQDPFYEKKEFAPSDKDATARRQRAVTRLIAPHLQLLQFLIDHFNATRLGSVHVQRVYQRLVMNTLAELTHPTGHPLTREVHFHFILFSLVVLKHSSALDAWGQWKLKDAILSAGLSWFSFPPRWSFGGNRLQVKAETHILAGLESELQKVAHIGLHSTGFLKSLRAKQELLQLLLDDEQSRLIVWLFPLEHSKRHYFGTRRAGPSETVLLAHLQTAWEESPAFAIRLNRRFRSAALVNELRRVLLREPHKATSEPDALPIILGSSLPPDASSMLKVDSSLLVVGFMLTYPKYLLYWAPVNPISAVNYFLPAYGNDPFILQYAMRALESHSVDVTFFYVPQIVQALRYDALGYVEQYIIETARVSQLFAHQIIWNMMANAYRDEESQVPDPIKPQLDKVMDSLVSSFSGPDQLFYEREFAFFREITDISGKLRPYIKKTKAEKKQKIEEELRKIKVEVGVYLPSNPNGIVIGIDRASGKPLQSHAKAPYLATFRIRKNLSEMEQTETMLEGFHNDESNNRETLQQQQQNTVDVWQSAIFKVGDDCRQDVLVLQMIAAFQGIFGHVGLDVYVYPYRVTATAPGCGVIDVLPNTISRDMLGREAVNGLYDYFVSKYGGKQSVRFQEARSNFVKSMAAYSVISYLLQLKDRHNGNIMIDEDGHILHIDFGFCFDIAPGGIRFERAPFKLTSEMIAVMGSRGSHHHDHDLPRDQQYDSGDQQRHHLPFRHHHHGNHTDKESQAYRWFEQLCIKAFLASRPYAEQLVHLVRPMLDSGLPCFKPFTVQHFRERFVLEKSEGEAADFMRDLIKKSRGSYSTKGYDQFQLLTNGIPY
ncbi:MAG: phosphatidylinositol-4- kinase [Watsoniomyces obsoletus]|nr:MAG: phosphatidylinositol-4- kinase [Watsoniomyces obsoletus]